MNKHYSLIVLGGGAAGFFAAVSAKNHLRDAPVVVMEKTSSLLSKVKISGGGRCNVTHACYDPVELAKNYPRGGKCLISAFTRFQPRDTVHWFSERGVKLKTESDGRVFPENDSSQTIIDCLLKESKKLGVEIALRQTISTISAQENGFMLSTAAGEKLSCEKLVLATGSHPAGHRFAKSLGHSIESPVPSLFTFNIPSSPLQDLAGVSVKDVSIKIEGSSLLQRGPILITHWGFSGPAVLKLSAWGARFLFEKGYKANCQINWLPDRPQSEVFEVFQNCRTNSPGLTIGSCNPFNLPKKLWRSFLGELKVDETKRLAEAGNSCFRSLAQKLTADTYAIDGKTTYKEEFVTCGGVNLSEVDFKTMESRLCKQLYFCGEILDIDGVTGGFNFQNAWTTGWIAGNAAAL